MDNGGDTEGTRCVKQPYMLDENWHWLKSACSENSKNEEGHLAKNKAVDKIKAFYHEVCKTAARLVIWWSPQ